jgi:ABC-type antimicrobial peptide transport system permease subunit
MQNQEDRDRPPLNEKWGVGDLTLIGAGIGGLLGLGHELVEAYFNDIMSQESFLQIVAEVGLGALAGAVLFAAIAIFRNRRRQT